MTWPLISGYTATDLFALVLLASLAIFLARTAVLVWRWRLGRPVADPLLAGLLRVPKRYLKDVHEIVAREPRSARMHAALAGGFLAAVLLSFVLHVLRIGGTVTAWAVLATLPLIAFGLRLQAGRRFPARPARLSGGAFYRLTAAFSLSLLFLGCAAAIPLLTEKAAAQALPILLVAACGMAGLGWLAWSVAGGPMRHAVAGVAYLAAHPRPQRFEGRISADLKPLDLDAARLGASRPADFAWSQLASFDACIQCGRCESVCPAFAAGLPLNPKKLINDLVAGMSSAGTALSYAGSPHPDVALPVVASGPDRPLVRHGVIDTSLALIHPETLWACTTCRACVYECPMTIEHVDAIVDLRRFETLELGETPGKASDALDNLRLTDTSGGGGTAARFDWAVDLHLPRIADKGETDCLLWLGESGFDRRNQRSLRAFVRLLQLAHVDFAVLGIEECDTGDLARRLGDEATFQRLALHNIETLSKYRFRRIITIDPHVLYSLRNEYPALGGVWPVVHHTELLDTLLRDGRLSVKSPVAQTVTYHDPCYLGRYNGETEAPRAILRHIGADIIEMERSGMRSSCCGGGGGAPLTDIPGKRRIPDMRMDHARETGAERIIAACPFCTQMLEGVTTPHPEISDIAEILLEAVEGHR